jgi:phosphatidylinositol alpha-1,6-mannosyltransferase
MSADCRCLALVTDAFGGWGGIAQYNRDFLEALIVCRVVSSITVIPRHAPDAVLPPAGIEQVEPRSSRIAYTLFALRTAFTSPFNVVFCGHLHMAPLAVAIAAVARASLIVQMHGIEAWPRPTWLQRASIRAADLVLCVSRHTRGRVLSWAEIAPERVVVLPNTVGESFNPGDGSALREEWGLESKKVLLTVGRIDARERYKGHDRVIKAIPKLLADDHDVVYVIIGEGDDRSRLERLAHELGVADRVRFTGGCATETIVEAYRMADLFVMPSTGEGFGIAFLEAMACGTPALGLTVAGARDALADGELGTAVSEADLPAAISRLLSRPKTASQELAAAVRARFGRAAFVANVDMAVQLLCPGPSDSRCAPGLG